MVDPPSKLKWDKENSVRVTVKICKNQNPELYQAIKESNTPSAFARQLMQSAIEKK